MKKHIFLVGLVGLAMIPHHPSMVSALGSVEYQKTEEMVQVATTTQEVKAKPKLTNEQIVVQLVDKYSLQYGVSKTALMRTLRNENSTFEFCRQSGLRYKAGNRWGFPEGTREQSFGVAQIHLPDHPKITKAQACDPDFSIEFMAKNFALGRASMWMGYSK